MTASALSNPQGQPRWDLFLRAFAKEVDDALKASIRDAWLRRAGAQVARDLALPPLRTLEELETSINRALAELGWGHARLEFDEASRLLGIIHERLPRLDAGEGDSSAWFPAVLEGLYTAWLGQQPDAGDANLAARRAPHPQADGSVVLLYGRRKWIENATSRGG